jgi:hypothetical protein
MKRYIIPGYLIICLGMVIGMYVNPPVDLPEVSYTTHRLEPIP